MSLDGQPRQGSGRDCGGQTLSGKSEPSVKTDSLYQRHCYVYTNPDHLAKDCEGAGVSMEEDWVWNHQHDAVSKKEWLYSLLIPRDVRPAM